MKDYGFYNRALKLDKKNAGKYYAGRAVLYFRDMEYDLAWQDFQEAEKCGIQLEDYPYYKILKYVNENKNTDINFEFDEKTTFRDVLRNINYCLITKKYKEANKIIGKVFESNFTLRNRGIYDMSFIREIQLAMFNKRKQYHKYMLEHSPRYESAYFSRIRLYVSYHDLFSAKEKKFYRQRINQTFDTLEKLSKKPECICLYRAKYFENLNEIRYAIKFCQKAVDIAKEKNDEGFVYIASSILKDLYIKNYETDKALEIAMVLIEKKPSPQVLSKAVNSFHYLPSLFNYKFPPEFEKYKSYRLISNNIKKIRKIRQEKFKQKNQKGCKNGKSYNR